MGESSSVLLLQEILQAVEDCSSSSSSCSLCRGPPSGSSSSEEDSSRSSFDGASTGSSDETSGDVLGGEGSPTRAEQQTRRLHRHSRLLLRGLQAAAAPLALVLQQQSAQQLQSNLLLPPALEELLAVVLEAQALVRLCCASATSESKMFQALLGRTTAQQCEEVALCLLDATHEVLDIVAVEPRCSSPLPSCAVDSCLGATASLDATAAHVEVLQNKVRQLDTVLAPRAVDSLPSITPPACGRHLRSLLSTRPSSMADASVSEVSGGAAGACASSPSHDLAGMSSSPSSPPHLARRFGALAAEAGVLSASDVLAEVAALELLLPILDDLVQLSAEGGDFGRPDGGFGEGGDEGEGKEGGDPAGLRVSGSDLMVVSHALHRLKAMAVAYGGATSVRSAAAVPADPVAESNDVIRSVSDSWLTSSACAATPLLSRSISGDEPLPLPPGRRLQQQQQQQWQVQRKLGPSSVAACNSTRSGSVAVMAPHPPATSPPHVRHRSPMRTAAARHRSPLRAAAAVQKHQERQERQQHLQQLQLCQQQRQVEQKDLKLLQEHTQQKQQMQEQQQQEKVEGQKEDVVGSRTSEEEEKQEQKKLEQSVQSELEGMQPQGQVYGQELDQEHDSTNGSATGPGVAAPRVAQAGPEAAAAPAASSAAVPFAPSLSSSSVTAAAAATTPMLAAAVDVGMVSEAATEAATMAPSLPPAGLSGPEAAPSASSSASELASPPPPSAPPPTSFTPPPAAQTSTEGAARVTAASAAPPSQPPPALAPPKPRAPKELRCPLSHELMVDPVIIASGYSFERSFIEAWFAQGRRVCPASETPLPPGPLSTFPNVALRVTIAAWCRENGVVLPTKPPCPKRLRPQAMRFLRAATDDEDEGETGGARESLAVATGGKAAAAVAVAAGPAKNAGGKPGGCSAGAAAAAAAVEAKAAAAAASKTAVAAAAAVAAASSTGRSSSSHGLDSSHALIASDSAASSGAMSTVSLASTGTTENLAESSLWGCSSASSASSSPSSASHGGEGEDEDAAEDPDNISSGNCLLSGSAASSDFSVEFAEPESDEDREGGENSVVQRSEDAFFKVKESSEAENLGWRTVTCQAVACNAEAEGTPGLEAGHTTSGATPSAPQQQHASAAAASASSGGSSMEVVASCSSVQEDPSFSSHEHRVVLGNESSNTVAPAVAASAAVASVAASAAVASAAASGEDGGAPVCLAPGDLQPSGDVSEGREEAGAPPQLQREASSKLRPPNPRPDRSTTPMETASPMWKQGLHSRSTSFTASAAVAAGEAAAAAATAPTNGPSRLHSTLLRQFSATASDRLAAAGFARTEAAASGAMPTQKYSQQQTSKVIVQKQQHQQIEQRRSAAWRSVSSFATERSSVHPAPTSSCIPRNQTTGADPVRLPTIPSRGMVGGSSSVLEKEVEAGPDKKDKSTLAMSASSNGLRDGYDSSRSASPDKGEHASGATKGSPEHSAADALVRMLSSASLEDRRRSALRIRQLAKSDEEARVRIAAAGAIRPLLGLLGERDLSLVETALYALLNLSISDAVKLELAGRRVIELLLHLHRCPSSGVREAATALLFSLSSSDAAKGLIGALGAIPFVVNVLVHGSSDRARQDALLTLFNLSLLSHNKPMLIQAHVLQPVVRLVQYAPGHKLADCALSLMRNLVTRQEGRDAVVEYRGIAALARALEWGSARGKEDAAAVLLSLCQWDPDHRAAVLEEGIGPSVAALLRTGSDRGRAKAQGLMEFVSAHYLKPRTKS